MDLCWKKGVGHFRIIITQDWVMQTEENRAWTKLLSPERDWCVIVSGVGRVAAPMTWSLPWWVTLAWSFHLSQLQFLKLKYSWFTVLCNFLVYRKWFSYTHTHTHTHTPNNIDWKPEHCLCSLLPHTHQSAPLCLHFHNQEDLLCGPSAPNLALLDSCSLLKK